MINAKATARSNPMMRSGTAQSTTSANPKQPLSAGPVQDVGGRASQGVQPGPSRGGKPADAFDASGANRRQSSTSSRLENALGVMGTAGELVNTFAPRGLPPELQNLTPAAQSAQPGQLAQPAQASGSGIPSANDKRPAGDKRSAAQIVDDSPVLKNLGRQKDIKFDQLCKQTGIDPKLDLKDAKQNPDAVYRLAKVLEFIDSAKASTGGDRSNKVQNGQGDGNIEGITKSGDARHGTEAGMVKDFAEQGYSFLGSHQLPTTKDTHVKADGSNKDNFQWFAGEAGKHLWFVPAVSNVLTGIGNSEGGLKGVLEGAATGYLKTLKGAAEGVVGAITSGRPNPASLLFGGAMGALGATEAAPQPVKDIANLF
ncbi:hypothetical protein LZ198_03095 [Myxococcus sp. K15C18031901]|uniref:hypothetical protein n=1 Tax=Myxococcus dinghuensis TaxID=2906761 RepID=UPI0020A82A27|nr:hypothetical protein [Myxococcus dinghuensis]MCP3097857.1 hypothetical protein [Myxococcus dinghuensis]